MRRHNSHEPVSGSKLVLSHEFVLEINLAIMTELFHKLEVRLLLR